MTTIRELSEGDYKARRDEIAKLWAARAEMNGWIILPDADVEDLEFMSCHVPGDHGTSNPLEPLGE